MLFGSTPGAKVALGATLWVDAPGSAVSVSPGDSTSYVVFQAVEWFVGPTLGVVVGGRLGYVLFYQPTKFFAEPLEIFKVWTGGMSFHGGFLGVCLAIVAVLLVGMAVQRARMRVGQAPGYGRGVP